MNHFRQKPTMATLLADQSDATEKFVALVTKFKSDLAAIDFPLDSPCLGYDIADIKGHVDDWLVMHDPETIRWMAADIVAEDRFLEGASRADARRALGGGER
jgi:hypothetical protein